MSRNKHNNKPASNPHRNKSRFIQRIVSFTITELNKNISKNDHHNGINGSILTNWVKQHPDINAEHDRWFSGDQKLSSIPVIRNVTNNLGKPEEWRLEVPAVTVMMYEEKEAELA